MVEMVLHRILISETNDQQYIFLKEKSGDRAFPIVIGFSEAQAIHRFVNERSAPRPMTHDLLLQVIESLGARLVRVDVTDLKESTFFASLQLEMSDGRTVEVDARPSDAVALAAATKSPIFVAERVVAESVVT